MKQLFTIVGLALILATTPAFADWQWSRWGMSPAQVEKSSKAVTALSGVPPEDAGADGITFKLQTPYTAGDYRFQVYFGFDAHNRLKLTALQLKSGTDINLLNSLEKKYGRAAKPTPLTWQWTTRRDVIEFHTDASGAASVVYGELVGPSEKGL